MILASLILILSTALFFFFFQITCQRILRRRFDREYFRSLAKANALEFPSLQESLEEYGVPLDYPRLRMMLRCDFLALTYLLKNAANVYQSYTLEERLLMLYFRWQFFLLAVRRSLKVGENDPALTLTSVLQYFANVVGQRVSGMNFGDSTAAGYYMNV